MEFTRKGSKVFRKEKKQFLRTSSLLIGANSGGRSIIEMLATITLGLGMIAWSIWTFRNDLADFREKGQGWGFLHLITGIPFTLGGFLLGIILILLSIWG